MTLDIRASATIERGITANRVRVRGRALRIKAAKAIAPSRKRGKLPADWKIIGVSIPVAMIAAIDDAASRLGVCRSEFIRIAALGLAVHAKGKQP